MISERVLPGPPAANESELNGKPSNVFAMMRAVFCSVMEILMASLALQVMSVGSPPLLHLRFPFRFEVRKRQATTGQDERAVIDPYGEENESIVSCFCAILKIL